MSHPSGPTSNVRLNSGEQVRAARLDLFCIAAVVVVALATWWTHSTGLEVVSAAGGQTVWPMLDREATPALRDLDPMCHADELRQSLYMRGFQLTEWIGIPRPTALSASILLGIGLLVVGSIRLMRSLHPSAPPTAWLVFAVWNLASPATRTDLANFGGGLSHSGQMYAPAFGLGLIALGAALRRSWITFGIAIGIAGLCHLAVGLVFGACGFAMGMATLDRRNLPRMIAGCTIAAALAGGWFLQALDQLPDQMSDEDWLRFARFGNYHWYPIDWGGFGRLHHWGAATVFFSVILAGGSAALGTFRGGRGTAFWWGMGAALGLTVCGLLAGIVNEWPFIVKVGLHRASAVMTQLSAAAIAFQLIAWLGDRRLLFRVAGGVILVVATVRGVGPLMAFVMAGLCCIRLAVPGRRVIAAAGLLMVGWLVSLAFRGHIQTAADLLIGSSRWGGRGALRVALPGGVLSIAPWKATALLLGVVMAVGFVFRRARGWRGIRVGVGIVVLAMLSASWIPLTAQRLARLSELPRKTDFLAAQRWAAATTPWDATFFVDPADEYGFRECSGRPTFGTPHEWIHTSFLYTGSRASFEEGCRRASLFGVDLEAFMAEDPGIWGWIACRNALRTAIHAMPPEEMHRIAGMEAIDFVVLRRENAGAWGDVEPRFANDSYLIYSTNRTESPASAEEGVENYRTWN